MKLVAKKRTLLPSTIMVAALALGCGSLAGQAAPLMSSSPLLPQAEPQKPGEERRKEQPAPPKGAQPQAQPQRPGTQGAQPPQGTSQPQERRQPPGAQKPGQPRTTQQPTQPPGAQQGGPAQPR